jgi:peptidoglycan hydrolase-like protein with peptidoglycan-binding domain
MNMGLLVCKLFTTPEGDPSLDKLEKCLVNDHDHITPGSRGEHVKKIQIALNSLSNGAGRENFRLKVTGVYDTKTASAVLTYKKKRKIINTAYQHEADNIVGKMTIKSLDDEMDILENEIPTPDAYVSLTPEGSLHDHSKCPLSPSYPGPDGRVHHMVTPINPRNTGRKVNIGGEGETQYLGFEDFLTDQEQCCGPPRPLTSTILSHTVSDICLRDSPISSAPKNGQAEIERIAQLGCRLTVASDTHFINGRTRSYLLSLGRVLEDIYVFKKPWEPDPFPREVLVISMLFHIP